VHTPEYVDKLMTGTLSSREELELEVPFSHELVEAFWLAAGGSTLAARQALADGVSRQHRWRISSCLSRIMAKDFA
jgi:acetoin utilization deacetylase AcuC-like enzyme